MRKEIPSPYVDQGCFFCGQKNAAGLHLTFFLDEEIGEVSTEYVASAPFVGFGTILHGGIESGLFDEIMAGLTPAEVGTMTKFVAELPARGITVIWVEHVLYAIMKTATRMLVINRGRLIAEGAPNQLARHPAVVKAYLGEEMVLA